MSITRRQFGKLAAVSLPFASAALANSEVVFGAEKPNSKFHGVQIGIIVPYSYHGMDNDAKSVLVTSLPTTSTPWR